MEYRIVETVKELKKLDLDSCYSRYGTIDEKCRPNAKLMQSLGVLLVGKSVVAEFMGITEKRLQRWFANDTKMPIRRQHRYVALTDDLIKWTINKQLESISNKDKNVVKIAQLILQGRGLNFSKEDIIYKTRRHYPKDEITTQRVRVHYKKTVDRVIDLMNISLCISLQSYQDGCSFGSVND